MQVGSTQKRTAGYRLGAAVVGVNGVATGPGGNPVRQPNPKEHTTCDVRPSGPAFSRASRSSRQPVPPLSPLAPPASAAAVGAIASSTTTTVYAALVNQPAGEWTTVALPAVANGDTITIQIDDNDGGVPTASDNCAVAGDGVGFASIPTATNTTAGNAATFTASLLQSTGPCDTANVDDTLKITVGTGGAAGAVVKISNIKLNVGNTVAVGALRYRLNDTGNTVNFTTTNSIASVSAVRVAPVDPLHLIAPSSQDAPVSNVAFQEQRPAALNAADICVRLIGPAGTTFESTPAPTLAASGGDGTGGGVTASGVDAKFPTTKVSGTATRFDISGLRVDTGPAVGPIDAIPFGSCASPGTALGPPIRLGFVGTVSRVPGNDRYATAQQIAAPLGCQAGRQVVVARGDNFPDALSASYLAGKNDVPILLTAPTSIPNETIAALKEMGADSIILIGGTVAISTGVEDAFKQLPVYDCATKQVKGTQKITVARATGADRYGTARTVALLGGVNGAGTTDAGLDGTACAGNLKRTAIVASGENFPDALSAGPLAYSGLLNAGGVCGSGPLPLLLTQTGGVPAATVNTILELGIEQVILMGGTAAVPTAVETAIDNLNGGAVNVVRIAGADRQGTAVELSKRVLGVAALGSYAIPTNIPAGAGTGFLVSRPDTFPDALAAAPLAGSTAAPLFLAASTTSLGATTLAGIVDYPAAPLFVRGVLLGGTAALSSQVQTDVGNAIASQATPAP